MKISFEQNSDVSIISDGTSRERRFMMMTFIRSTNDWSFKLFEILIKVMNTFFAASRIVVRQVAILQPGSF